MKPPENVKFWTVLAGFILLVSVTVMLVDISIKSSILEQSNKFRRLLWLLEEEHGRGTQEADSAGDTVDYPYPGSLLDFNTAGMEVGNVPPLANGKASPSRARKPRATKPKPESNSGEVPSGN